MTIIDTHGKDRTDIKVVRKGDTWQIGDWMIRCNLTPTGKAAINISNKTEKASLIYDAAKNEGATLINEQTDGKKIEKKLVDYLPDFEI